MTAAIDTSTSYPQIFTLFKDGLSPDQIAETLDLPVDVVLIALDKQSVENNGPKTINQVRASLQIRALEVLGDIINDENAHASSRVAAARAVLSEDATETKQAMDKIKKNYEEMQKVLQQHLKTTRPSNLVELKKPTAIDDIATSESVKEVINACPFGSSPEEKLQLMQEKGLISKDN